MSIMGVGSCTLGYSDHDVNTAVKKVIDEGSMCTLNSPEEIELAELLLSIHPWADMVRYARTGGECMSITVRIARAYTKREKVAFCGYHGWHDWYISSNLSSDNNLDGHLLPGLNPNGIPRGLANTAIPFEYNKIEQLQNIANKEKLAAIVMEPYRNQLPKEGFLEKVKKIAEENGAVLIFDEITSGWRSNLGGTHLELGVIPDIVTYAKAMSNGYPMAAIIGNKKVMDTVQDTFISSTYWTERVGPAAAIATINKMQKVQSWEHITKMGRIIWDGWEKAAKKHGINIEVHGPECLVGFKFEYPEANALRTLFTQEMLKKGYLAGTSVYVSYSHKEQHINDYLVAVDSVFNLIKKAITEGKVKEHLEGAVAEDGFKRLT
jgi:glutamate-1-semialdehyde aminotransferase